MASTSVPPASDKKQDDNKTMPLDELRDMAKRVNEKRKKANLPLCEIKEVYAVRSDEYHLLPSIINEKRQLKALEEEAELHYAEILIPGPNIKDFSLRWEIGDHSGSLPLPRLKQVVKDKDEAFMMFYQTIEKTIVDLLVKYPNKDGGDFKFVDTDGKVFAYGEVFDRCYNIVTFHA